MNLTSWILAARPKTLPAALAPVGTGTALGSTLSDTLHLHLALCALGTCLALQVATNFFNDAIDFHKRADTPQRLGPTRASASGLLASKQVIIAALLALFIACVCALPLIWHRGWPIVVTIVPSLYLCFGYTGGPFPLAYRGLGDLFVLLFFGLAAVTVSCYIQTSRFDMEALLLGTQIGLLSTSLIAINNLRDRHEDARAYKQTLAVRWGQGFSKIEVGICLMGPYVVGLLWLLTSLGSAPAIWPLIALPLAMTITLLIATREPSPFFNRLLGLSSLHLLIFSAIFILSINQ